MKTPPPKKARPPHSAREWTRWKAWAALGLIAFAVYANSLGLGLAQDSRVMVPQDERIRAVSLENLKRILATDYWWPRAVDRLYRPVTTTSLLVNYAVLGNGPNPAGYHAVNLLLHAVNAGLVYELALLILPGGTAAFFAAALWTAHPIATEAVDNVVGRADLLAAAGLLGGLLLYVGGLRSEGRSRTLAAAALFVTALAGALSKESAVVLIAVMALWDLVFARDELRAGLARRVPFYGAAAAAVAILLAARAAVFASLAWPQAPLLDNVMRGAGAVTARLTAVEVIGRYLWLLVWPVGLSVDRSFDQIGLARWSDLWLWVSGAAVAGIAVAAFMAQRRWPAGLFLAGFFALTLLAASNLVVIIGSIMAERFLYLPSVAFAIALAGAARQRLAPRTATLALASLVVLFGARTLARNAEWHDDLTLSAADVKTAPRSARLHSTLAKSLFEHDDRRNIDRAIAEQETAWEIVRPVEAAQSSELVPAYLGIYYFTKAGYAGAPGNDAGRPWYEKAVAALSRAGEIATARDNAFDQEQAAHGKPPAPRNTFALLYAYLGQAHLSLGHPAEALRSFQAGRLRDPRQALFYEGMAAAYLRAERPDGAALALLEQAVAGNQADLRALGEVYARIPEGSCAVEGGRLNLRCARLHSDLCRAAADLVRALSDARMPDAARATREMAAGQYGCDAAAPVMALPEL